MPANRYRVLVVNILNKILLLGKEEYPTEGRGRWLIL
jgi:hypothetical protein